MSINTAKLRNQQKPPAKKGMHSARPTERGSSAREIREAMSKSPVVVESSRGTQPKPKRKSMLFSGLFRKEPSMVALEELSARMQARRDSTKGRIIPYVSSQKMPPLVPKVNSKWDGIPDAIKEKGRATVTAKRTSLMAPMNGLRIGGLNGISSSRRASSFAESWDSRSTASRPDIVDEPHNRYASGYDDSSEPGHQQQSLKPRSQPLPLKTASSLYEPTACISTNSSSTASRSMAWSCGTKASSPLLSTSIEPTVEHSAFSLPSPPKGSPQTPGQYDEMLRMDENHSIPVNAFPAGEAKFLQLPTDSLPLSKSAYSLKT